jgi:hypothetical protein
MMNGITSEIDQSQNDHTIHQFHGETITAEHKSLTTSPQIYSRSVSADNLFGTKRSTQNHDLQSQRNQINNDNNATMQQCNHAHDGNARRNQYSETIG